MPHPDRKRVAMLIDSLGMGGAERLLTIYLQHFDTTRFEPRVCALQIRENNPIAVDIQRLGIPVDLVPVPHLRDLSALPRLVRYLRHQQIDLLHTQLEFSDTLGSIAAKLAGIPTATTLHTFDVPTKGTRLYWRLALRWWVFRHFCDRIIAVSEGTRQHHLHMGQLSPHKTVTLYNGIDLARFSPPHTEARQSTRAEFGIPPDAPVLITVAVLRQPKGIQYLIQALPDILKAMPHAYYLLVGDGEHRDTLQTLAQTHGVADRVIFAGARRDIPSLLAAADLFVLPTLTEALPTVLAEAMAAQKPIVASEVGGVPEMVKHGHNGLLVQPAEPEQLADACLQILQNPGQAQIMAAAGRQIVEEKFDITKQVRHLGDIYQQILTERGRWSAP